MNFLSKILKFALAFLLIFPANSFAVVFTLEKDEWFIREKVGNSIERTGTLSKGSKLEIPDEYARYDASGKLDREATVNFWLSKTLPGSVPGPKVSSGLFDYGKQQPGYFVPVKVLESAKGSTKNDSPHDYKNETVFLQINFLADKGKWFENVASAPVVKSPYGDAFRAYIKQVNVTTQNVSEANPECCIKITADPSSPLGKLAGELNKVLAKIDILTDRGVANATQVLTRIEDTFRKTCKMEISDFMKTLQQKTAEAGIPWQFLAGKMIDESQGNCNANRTESDRTSSLGLLQINTDRKGVPGCEKPKDRTWLKKPLNNLSCAIVVYKEKVDMLVAGGFDRSFFSAESIDSARVLAASFNGGQNHLVRAKKDLEQFNERHGTNYDYKNWEHLKIFMLRGMLSDRAEKEAFGDNVSRRGHWTENNIAYVDKLFGQSDTPKEQTLVGMAQSMWSS